MGTMRASNSEEWENPIQENVYPGYSNQDINHNDGRECHTYCQGGESKRVFLEISSRGALWCRFRIRRGWVQKQPEEFRHLLRYVGIIVVA